MDSVRIDLYKTMRTRLKKWAQSKEGKKNQWVEYLMCAPDLLHLLCKLALERDVPAVEKAKLAGAIAYFISPVDLLSEAVVGPVGYLDDVALAAYVLRRIVNKTSADVVQRHWAGDGDVLDLIQQILDVADEMLGAGLWAKVKKAGGR